MVHAPKGSTTVTDANRDVWGIVAASLSTRDRLNVLLTSRAVCRAVCRAERDLVALLMVAVSHPGLEERVMADQLKSVKDLKAECDSVGLAFGWSARPQREELTDILGTRRKTLWNARRWPPRPATVALIVSEANAEPAAFGTALAAVMSAHRVDDACQCLKSK